MFTGRRLNRNHKSEFGRSPSRDLPPITRTGVAPPLLVSGAWEPSFKVSPVVVAACKLGMQKLTFF